MRDESKDSGFHPSSLIPHPFKVHAAMFAVASLFSINYIISKVGRRSFEPLSFAWLRVAGSAILLNAAIPGVVFSRRDSWQIAGFACLGVVLNPPMFLV